MTQRLLASGVAPAESVGTLEFPELGSRSSEGRGWIVAVHPDCPTISLRQFRIFPRRGLTAGFGASVPEPAGERRKAMAKRCLARDHGLQGLWWRWQTAPARVWHASCRSRTWKFAVTSSFAVRTAGKENKMRRLFLALAVLGLFAVASASAFADETIVGPTTVYTPTPTTIVTQETPTPVGWYVGRPYWGGYSTYYPDYYAPGYYYGPRYVYPGPVYPYRPYAYPWRAYRFGRVWW
jgi:hypothetical protein